MFEAGIQDHDGTLAFASLDDAAMRWARRAAARKGLAVQLPDSLAAPRLCRAARELAGARWRRALVVTDWTQEHASYFRAIRIEKTMMALILLLIVGGRRLQHRGHAGDGGHRQAHRHRHPAHPGRRVRARMARCSSSQGLVIGWFGVLAGVVLGVLVAHNVGRHPAGCSSSVFGLQIFDADVYYITQVPSELHWLRRAAGGRQRAAGHGAGHHLSRACARRPRSPAEALRYE